MSMVVNVTTYSEFTEIEPSDTEIREFKINNPHAILRARLESGELRRVEVEVLDSPATTRLRNVSPAYDGLAEDLGEFIREVEGVAEKIRFYSTEEGEQGMVYRYSVP